MNSGWFLCIFSLPVTSSFLLHLPEFFSAILVQHLRTPGTPSDGEQALLWDIVGEAITQASCLAWPKSAIVKKSCMTSLKLLLKCPFLEEVYGKPAEAEHAAGQQCLWACARAGSWEQSLQPQCWFVSCWEGAVVDTGNACGQLEEASGNWLQNVPLPFFHLWTTLD